MNREISVQVSDAGGKTWDFSGLKEMQAFFESELVYWKENRESLGEKNRMHPYLNSVTHLEQITNAMKDWVKNLDSWDEATFNQQVQNLRRSHLNNLASHWLWSGHPYSSVFVECHKDYNQQTATSFIDLILKKQIGNVSNRDNFFGVMLAYEFLNQDSDLTKRRNGEKVSLDELRGQLEKTTTL